MDEIRMFPGVRRTTTRQIVETARVNYSRWVRLFEHSGRVAHEASG
jgi:hypothetical protein